MPLPRTGLATELYAEIARYLSKDELASLALASTTLHAVATRMLYNRIELGDGTPRRTAIILLLALRGNKNLTALPRHMELHWTQPHKGDTPGLPASLLAEVLPTLNNLTYFSISPCLDIFTWAFDDVVCPSLVQFHSYGPGLVSSRFLVHHPRLTHLTLCQSTGARFSLLDPLEDLVYLRASCIPIIEQFLVRHSHPKLERVVFGEPLQVNPLLRALSSHTPPIRHLDIVGYMTFGDGRYFRPLAPEAQDITSLGVALCDMLPAFVAALEGEDTTILPNLRQIKELFPNITTLAIHCSNSTHFHQHTAAVAFAGFRKALRQADLEGFNNVCISEFLGCPVMSVHRDGERQWANVPQDHQPQKEYQAIPWPER